MTQRLSILYYVKEMIALFIFSYMSLLPIGYKLVLVDSCVKHELASSAYNKRRESCENAARAIRKNHPEVEFLSDAKRVWLEEVREEIPAEDFLRAEYVIGEVLAHNVTIVYESIAPSFLVLMSS